MVIQISLKSKRKLASNTIYLFFNHISITFFSFFFWLVIGKMLLPGKYGIISTSANLALALTTITTFGFSLPIIKLIPEYLEKKNKLKVKSLIKFVLKFVTFTSIAASIPLIVFSDFLEPLLNIPADAIKFVGLSLLPVSICQISSSIVMSFQDMRRLSITSFVGYLVKVLLATTLIFLGFSYMGGLFGFVAVFITMIILRLDYIFPGYKLFNKLSKLPSRISSKISKINRKSIILNYSLPIFAAQLAGTILHNGQYVILTFLKSAEVTGIFSITMLITSPILVVPMIMSTALAPIISQLSVKKRKREQSGLIISIFRYTLFLTLPLGIMIIGMAEPLILLVSRSEYLSAYSLFPTVALASIFYAIGNVFNSGLYFASGKTKLYRNIIVATTLLFLFVSFPLTYYFSSFGMATSYMIAMLFTAILGYIFIKKHIPLELPKKNIAKLLIASIVLYAAIQAFSPLIQDIILGSFIVLSCGVVYLLILIPLKFYREDDIKALYYIATRSPILKKQLVRLVEIISGIII